MRCSALEEGGDLLSGLLATGHGADDERGAVGGVAADENVLRVLRMLGLEESHGEEHELGLDDFGLSGLDHDGTTAGGIGLPINGLDADAGEFAVLAEELESVDVPAAGAAFFVTRSSLEGAGPLGPGVLWILGAFDGLGHDLDLRDALAALAMGGADAVGAGVAAADYQYIFSFGSNALVLRELHAGEDAVLLGEEFEGEVYALEFATGSLEVAGHRRAGGDDDGKPTPIPSRGEGRLVTQSLVEFLDRKVIKPSLPRGELEGGTVSELNPLLLHQLDAAVNNRLVELEIGDTVAQKPAGGFVLLEDGDAVAHLVKVVGGSETGGTGADDGDALAVAAGGNVRLDVALAEGGLDDGALILTVRGGLVVEAVEHAGLLAERGTDAAGELGEGVGRRQELIGQLPVAFVERVVPFGSLVAQRTGPVAEGHAAVHAARGLQLAFARRERLLYLAEVVDSIVNRTVTRLLAVYL